MRTESILHAIEMLDRAARALRSGRESIEVQMTIGMDCYRAEAALRADLLKDIPTVRVKEPA